MATITQRTNKNGETIYKFTTCIERDELGKQVRKSTTWQPPKDITPAKLKRAVERAAEDWEDEVREQYFYQKENANRVLLPQDRCDDFVSFVNDTWFDNYVCNGERKPATVLFYKDIKKYIVQYFKGADIKSVQNILGHSDASTTLNFYVKADIKQMQSATQMYAKAFNL